MFPKIKEYYIAAHLRRGDYLTKFAKIYCTVSKKSYFMACDKFNLDKSKIVWISEESPQDSKIIIDKDIEFLTDFFILLNADVILRANSTFSWWAGVLGNSKIYSPVVGSKVGMHDVDFVEGNWPMMLDAKNNLNYPTFHSDLKLREE
ncbi:MAG: hypothetical protein HC836_47265 [Richelia sp. RM2_1_2]|nr:hypothetical protein [Richelia sp. RM2_1_2]